MSALFERYFPGNGPRFKLKRMGYFSLSPLAAGLSHMGYGLGGHDSTHIVMAGLVPAIHAFP
ncbi:hypothetical protein CO683_31900 [Bradyrhizobium ottawaense]|nr:hypothetical protein [Bradyrhizobium sp. CCBAU 25360]MDA9450716.1 hypothetical protein [Bradyrhizobium sp. CCBAU 21360]MDA9458467.1 hypothetical protein [Bradyrhizobium sp. CCBAU 21359]MDA9517734.1 hypothetical protein [Bradyrhizobium sp. CCBAU 11430]PDT65576.1 hypothetical protein CO683_31900 [Bradyrhizobium ottawaense]